MKAITVVPGRPDETRVRDVPDATPGPDDLLVEGRLLGICGTDADILEGYGWTPPGRDYLVIGHESLGTVVQAPSGSGFTEGDLVAGIVRRPDPVPCIPCSNDEWDFCRNGKYTERGIKELGGYGSELWSVEPKYAIKLDASLGDCGVLLEPASILAKAWDQIERFTPRTSWRPEVALITGAGPIGLLAALMAGQRGLDVHVLDHNDRGRKRQLVTDLGATFHVGTPADLNITPDVVVECTGHGPLAIDLAKVVSPDAIIALTGISPSKETTEAALDEVNQKIVLGNTLIFGTVNASRRNFEQAAEALHKADCTWLDSLITRRVPMDDFMDGLHKQPNDVKVVVDLQL